MDTIECITTRMSIRKFKPEPIPKDVLEDVIATAQRSPSYKNSQPWEVLVIAGEKKKALSELMLGLVKNDTEKSPDIEPPKSWPQAEQARIDDLFQRRKEESGIDLSDPKISTASKKANFRFFGAPHAIYLLQDASLSDWSLIDIGLFAQSLMLAGHAKGIGTVPQAFVTDYAGHIKEFLNIPKTKRLVLGLSIGYPDMDSPVNAFRSDRTATDDIVTWLK